MEEHPAIKRQTKFWKEHPAIKRQTNFGRAPYYHTVNQILEEHLAIKRQTKFWKEHSAIKQQTKYWKGNPALSNGKLHFFGKSPLLYQTANQISESVSCYQTYITLY